MTGKPCIICVAITGSLPRKEHNPAVPITVSEQVESTHEAFEAGATICHAHVRNDDQTPSSDPEKFARLKEGLEKHCPGMIIQFSTGGRSGAGKARGGMLPLKPDMASLTVGSNNFPTRVYENPPDLVDWLASEMRTYGIKPEIEAFDLSHIFQAVKMVEDGSLTGPLYVQFVMGVKNAMPVDKDVFDFYVKTLNRLAPDALWCGAGACRSVEGTGPMTDVAEMSFEDALRELEQVVGQLERGEVPLDQSIALYERGAALKARCEAKLKEAEEKVAKLTLDGEGVPTGTTPLDAG